MRRPLEAAPHRRRGALAHAWTCTAALALAACGGGPPADESPAALFDRGLRAVAADDLAGATHEFRRVLLRAPGQPDALANLERATAALGVATDGELAADGELRADGLRGAVEGLPPALCMVLIAGLQGLGLVGFVLADRRRGLWLVPAALGLGLAGLRAHYFWNADPAWASVLAPRAAMRTEAAANGAVMLTLRAGEAVRADLWTAEWVRVRQGDDAGWVARSALAPVD